MELHRWPLDFLYSCTPERWLFMRLRQKRDEHIVCPRMKMHECYRSNPHGFMSMSGRHSLSGGPTSKQSDRKVPGPVWQACLKGFGRVRFARTPIFAPVWTAGWCKAVRMPFALLADFQAALGGVAHVGFHTRSEKMVQFTQVPHIVGTTRGGSKVRRVG